MAPDSPAVRSGLRTPRAAAVAGIAFSLLLMASLALLWASIPENPLETEAEVIRNSRRISVALDLLPFAGIAFLWFVGVLRDRLGEKEDRFFATVFLGSGLLFLAMLFVAAAMAGGLVRILNEGAAPLVQARAYALGRLQIRQTVHVYALKMAGVFMFSTATVFLKTRIAPSWLAYLGYALALALILLSGSFTKWIPLTFPLWVLVVSVYILFDNFRRSGPA